MERCRLWKAGADCICTRIESCLVGGKVVEEVWRSFQRTDASGSPMSKKSSSTEKAAAELASELSIIWVKFAAHMRRGGYARSTIRQYQNSLERVAAWLVDNGRSLRAITADDVPLILRDFFLKQFRCRTITRHRPALYSWLRFLKRSCRLTPKEAHAGWVPWADSYDRFLAEDRGLAGHTRIYRRRYTQMFLRWCFRDGPACWNRVTPQDIWRFAERFSGRIKPASINLMLSSLRSLLRYAQLREACGPELAAAVPHVANYGNERGVEVLSEQQRRKLLKAFTVNTVRGLRDYAIALCLVDLGLRASDVVHLRLSDFDRPGRSLTVFSSKTGSQRQLPVSDRIAGAIGSYIRKARPAVASDQLFLRISAPVDSPLGVQTVRSAIRRAYARCGFPPHWTGTHRLRHGFATRLYTRGADLHQIGKLLGHRAIESTNRYAQVDLRSLRSLAQRWPT